MNSTGGSEGGWFVPLRPPGVVVVGPSSDKDGGGGVGDTFSLFVSFVSEHLQMDNDDTTLLIVCLHLTVIKTSN